MPFSTAAILTAWIFIVLLSLGFAALVGQVTYLTKKLETHGQMGTNRRHPLIGMRAPEHSAVNSVAQVGKTLAIFTSHRCVSCMALLSDLAAEPPAGVQVLILVRGDCGDLPLDRSFSCVENADQEFDLFGVVATPFSMIINENGVVEYAGLGKPTSEALDVGMAAN